MSRAHDLALTVREWYCPRASDFGSKHAEARAALSELELLADEAERYRAALEEIAETSRWYANNGGRLAHEVDHALCVEIVSTSERALEASG